MYISIYIYICIYIHSYERDKPMIGGYTRMRIDTWWTLHLHTLSIYCTLYMYVLPNMYYIHIHM